MTSADTFEVLAREYYEPLFRFALSLTRAEADARDLTQQTFYVWATRGHQLRDISRAKTWLFTTLHRAFLGGQRRQSRFPQEDLSPEFPSSAPEAPERSGTSEVLPALTQVDEVYQSAVMLYYLENRSYKDIALVLAVPIGTVKSRIARGIAQLRELLPAAQVETCRNLNPQ
jgi:RNA polymerase sigma-70 factor, ECF subfamily